MASSDKPIRTRATPSAGATHPTRSSAIDLAEIGPTDPKWHPYRDPSPSASPSSSSPPPACWSDDAVRVIATPPEPDTRRGLVFTIVGRETRERETPDSLIANAAEREPDSEAVGKSL